MRTVEIAELMARKVARAERVAAMLQKRECLDRATTAESADLTAEEIARLDRIGNAMRKILSL